MVDKDFDIECSVKREKNKGGGRLIINQPQHFPVKHCFLATARPYLVDRLLVD